MWWVTVASPTGLQGEAAGIIGEVQRMMAAGATGRQHAQEWPREVKRLS